MKLNKKALGALASFYERRGMMYFCDNDKEVMDVLFLSCITDDDFDLSEVSRTMQHCEIFFRVDDMRASYLQKLNDKSVAKLLRTIARNGKFPKVRSLRYVC